MEVNAESGPGPGSPAPPALRPRHALDMQEMAGLDPGRAAFGTGRRLQHAGGREPQPGLRCEMVAAFVEAAIEHQEFGAAEQGERDHGAGVPAFEPNLFAAILK